MIGIVVSGIGIVLVIIGFIWISLLKKRMSVCKQTFDNTPSQLPNNAANNALTFEQQSILNRVTVDAFFEAKRVYELCDKNLHYQLKWAKIFIFSGVLLFVIGLGYYFYSKYTVLGSSL